MALSEPSTIVECDGCGGRHAAHFRERDGGVHLEADCDGAHRSQRVSSDLELFTRFRCQGRHTLSSEPPQSSRPQVAILEITDACGWECPICYAGAGPRPAPWFLPVEEAASRARRLARAGGRHISLSGGEPTLHPRLPEIVRAVRAEGLHTLLVTNGQAAAEQAGLLPALRRAGLHKVQLQLDTFRPDVYRRMRGRTDPDEKRRAIDAVLRAGLRLGFVTTVCAWNLDELGTILDLGVSLAPRLNTLWFQCAAPAGRFLVPAEVVVDREAVVRALARDARAARFEPCDFFPSPPFAPWGLAVHPDCEVNLLLARDGDTHAPLTRLLDMDRLCAELAASPGRRRPVASALLLATLLRSTRRGRCLQVAAGLASLLTGRGRPATVAVLAGSFVGNGLRDVARQARCAAVVLRGDGFVSPCRAYGGRPPLAGTER